MRKYLLVLIFLFLTVVAYSKTNEVPQTISNSKQQEKITEFDNKVTKALSTIDEKISNFNKLNENNIDRLNMQERLIANTKWHIDGLLILIGIIAAIMGFILYRGAITAKNDMNEAKKDYAIAKEKYNSTLDKLDECTTKADSLIKDTTEKINNLIKGAEKKLNNTTIYAQKIILDATQNINKISVDTTATINELIKNAKTNIDQISSQAAEQAIAKMKNEQEKQNKLNFLNNEANQNLQKNDYAKTLELSNEILSLDPDNAWGYCIKALSIFELEKTDDGLKKALENINKAIAINLEYAPFYAFRALVHTLLGNIEFAFQDRKKVEELKPNDINEKFNMIELKILLNRLDEAELELSKIKDISQKPEIYKVSYNILSALLQYIKYGNFTESINIIEKNIYPTTGQIDWSFEEIKKNLILKDSYLTQTQKNDINKIINLIEEEQNKRKNLTKK